jgi:thioredoxin 1
MTANVVVLTKQNFDAFLETDQVAVVYFWAEWCEPCKGFKTVFNKVVSQFPAVQFATIDVETEKELMEDFGIRSVPTIMIFRNHVALCMESGALTEKALKELIDQAVSLDMHKVHQQIAKKMIRE